jgi:CRISP-associated protein Cas1
VVIDGSGDITLDAIDWLARHRVPVTRVRWDGQFASIITSGGQAASASKVQWQQQTRDNPRARLEFATDLIRQKAENTLITLEGSCHAAYSGIVPARTSRAGSTR